MFVRSRCFRIWSWWPRTCRTPACRQTVTDLAATPPAWRVGDDVVHTAYGHGWIQGAGHGVMTVRFETRSTGPGPARTIPDDDPGIARANPVDSLDWPDYISELARYQSTP